VDKKATVRSLTHSLVERDPNRQKGRPRVTHP